MAVLFCSSNNYAEIAFFDFFHLMFAEIMLIYLNEITKKKKKILHQANTLFRLFCSKIKSLSLNIFFSSLLSSVNKNNSNSSTSFLIYKTNEWDPVADLCDKLAATSCQIIEQLFNSHTLPSTFLETLNIRNIIITKFSNELFMKYFNKNFHNVTIENGQP